MSGRVLRKQISAAVWAVWLRKDFMLGTILSLKYHASLLYDSYYCWLIL